MEILAYRSKFEVGHKETWLFLEEKKKDSEQWLLWQELIDRKEHTGKEARSCEEQKRTIERKPYVSTNLSYSKERKEHILGREYWTDLCVGLIAPHRRK